MNKTKLFITLTTFFLAVFLAAPTAFASSSLSGSYDSFSGVCGNGSGNCNPHTYVFNSGGSSLGGATDLNIDLPTFSNKTIPNLGGPTGSGSLSSGNYTMIVSFTGDGGGLDTGAENKCGSGHTLTECQTYYGSLPLTLDYAVSTTFTIEDAPPADPVPGCMDSTATNYNNLSTEDDGSCLYPILTSRVDNTNTTQYTPTTQGWEILNDIEEKMIFIGGLIIFILVFTLGRSLIRR